ncbi:aspartate ammonia-lyase [Desulfoferula mesophila]|uniref:Aspartate ammonia-lyase n=1 Tax=Desulfoferula mesophila TaxID=3058419 RepID=A0AAU9F191_9BACT|nr:aspartate ammonia-lyase [Desulfoferula mesophilus]
MNNQLGLLPTDLCLAIVEACDEIIRGEWHEAFVVDVIQGGAGTSTNMNANEVIANRALEILGHKKGQYKHLHPNTHVNMSQSTNDVCPTALRVTLIIMCRDLIATMVSLQRSLENKAREFQDIIKVGRTQLQDAVPMTLGQEFRAYAIMIAEDICRLDEAKDLVREINLGGTAIGTGLNAPIGYAKLITARLSKLTGIRLKTSANLVEATQDAGAYVQLSGVLKRVAVKLSKICNDLRLLSSGPRCGLGEINLPNMAPGSSIMPGKVNPIIPEVVNQVAFQVIGNDLTITMAAEAGQLELNAMQPIIAYDLFESLSLLQRGIHTLCHKCVRGITANPKRCRELMEKSIGLATALNPVLGYEKSTKIALEALHTGKSIYSLVLEKNLLDKARLDELLSPENMIVQ